MKKELLLQHIGFGKHEAKVYECLLRLGTASIAAIVRDSGLHRPLVYKAMPILIEKGLVSIMPKGKGRVYVPASPEKLEQMFKDREAEFFRSIEDLHAMYEKNDKKPVITVTQGKKAVMDAYAHIVNELPKGGTYYRYSSTRALNRERYVPKGYRETRDKKQLERLIITNTPSKLRSADKLGRTIKAVPQDYDLFEYDVTQVIYGNKVVFADYNSDTVITIENPMIAEFQKKLFKLLFRKL